MGPGLRRDDRKKAIAEYNYELRNHRKTGAT